MLMGNNVKVLTTNIISRLKSQWLDENDQWRHQDLSRKLYVCVWGNAFTTKPAQLVVFTLVIIVVIGMVKNWSLLKVGIESPQIAKSFMF